MSAADISTWPAWVWMLITLSAVFLPLVWGIFRRTYELEKHLSLEEDRKKKGGCARIAELEGLAHNSKGEPWIAVAAMQQARIAELEAEHRTPEEISLAAAEARIAELEAEDIKNIWRIVQLEARQAELEAKLIKREDSDPLDGRTRD